MGQAIVINQKNYSSALHVVKETQPANNDLPHLVNTAWNFAYTALWNDVQFSSKEMENAKLQIAAWLQSEIKKRHSLLFANGYCWPASM